MKVSVIVVCFNSASYVRSSVDSDLVQKIYRMITAGAVKRVCLGNKDRIHVIDNLSFSVASKKYKKIITDAAGILAESREEN